MDCKNKHEFIIIGEVKNLPFSTKIYLFDDAVGGYGNSAEPLLPINSTVLDDKGKFQFKGRSFHSSRYYIKFLDDERFYVVVAKNGDRIKFKINYADILKYEKYKRIPYEIEGSKESEKLMELQQIFHKNCTNDFLSFDKEEEFFYKSKNVSKKELLEFAEKNAEYLAAFEAVISIESDVYASRLFKVARRMKKRFPYNKAIERFYTQLDLLKSFYGKKVPDFELSNPDGHFIKLSDFRGNYILLNFWASWCDACRQEHPNLVKLYRLFKNENFTVLSVSLDNNRAEWLKAIREDQLGWSQVSDLKGWASEVLAKYNKFLYKVKFYYEIKTLPASFILDPEGKIICDNLYGEDLEVFLRTNL